MSQPVASSEPLTDVPICAAVRSIPSRTNPVGLQLAAIAAAGAAAMAIVAIMADAEARPTRRRLVMKLDIVFSDWTLGCLLTSRILIGRLPRSHRPTVQNETGVAARMRQAAETRRRRGGGAIGRRQAASALVEATGHGPPLVGLAGSAGSGGRIRTYDQVINSHPL